MIGVKRGPEVGVGEALPGSLRHLLGAIEAYVAEGVPPGPAEEAHELVHLRRGMDRLDLHFSLTAGQFAQSEYWDDEGFISPYQWVRLNCKMGGGAGGQRITVGQQAEALPQSTAALERGEIGFGHLALLAGLRRSLEDSKMLTSFSEQPLLDQARRLSVREFAKACQLARTVMDRKGHELEQMDQSLRQSLWMKHCEDGMWVGRFLLNNENGAAMDVLIKALSKKNGVGDERPLALRQAWALAEAVQHALRTMKLPMTNYRVPQLQVTASIESLLGAIGAPGAQLDDAHPINIETLRRIACDCAVSRVILAGDSSVLEVGEWTRCVSPSLRRAAVHRDRKCRWPGCDRPASWTEAHHVTPWALGGRTDLANTLMVCYRHHYLLHEGKWTLVVKKDGEVVVVPPNYRTTAAAS